MTDPTALRADLTLFAQKIERRTLAVLRGDHEAAALEQRNIELVVRQICQHLEPEQRPT